LIEKVVNVEGKVLGSKLLLTENNSVQVLKIIIIIIMAKEQYIKRRDRVCAQLHFNICKETAVQLDKKQWYEHVPKSVETSQGGKVIIP